MMPAPVRTLRAARNRRFNLKLFTPALLIATMGFGSAILAQPSAPAGSAEQGQSIGQLEPVFLPFDQRPLPRVDAEDAADRYRQLFRDSDQPEIRIDALNRLEALTGGSGRPTAGVQPDISIAEMQAMQNEALGSYERILEQGRYSGRLDELIYQMAKAYALVGETDQSNERLRQLIGLYPNSQYVPEAHFRLGEAQFSAGEYPEAVASYRKVLSSDAPQALKSRALYMMGWSQFQAGNYQEAGRTFIEVLDSQAEPTDNFSKIPPGSAELIDDTFRILALMTAENGGLPALDSLLAYTGTRDYEFLLYDRLADYYAVRDNPEDSDAVSLAFIRKPGKHPQDPAFYVQRIELWRAMGDATRAEAATDDFIARYLRPADWRGMSSRYREEWVERTRRLADIHYDRGSNQAGNRSPAVGAADFARAAELYEALAARQRENIELYRLAGDAWLQAQRYMAAKEAFRKAGYPDEIHRLDADTADAAWASLTLSAQALDGEIPLDVTLDETMAEIRWYATSYPVDKRLPQVQASLANHLLEADRPRDASDYARAVIAFGESEPGPRLSAQLVLGQVAMDEQDYASAELAWRAANEIQAQYPSVRLPAEDQKRLENQLATAIYRQGEEADRRGLFELAVSNFLRVGDVAPGSPIAIKAEFDAANALLRSDRWLEAIDLLRRFRKEHSSHPLTAGISDKLVLAYTSSQQPDLAAEELMATSRNANGTVNWDRRLRAAELYDAAGATDERNSLYRQYLKTTPVASSADQHVRLQTFRHRLIESGAAAPDTRETLVSAEFSSEWHSETTLAWTAQYALELGSEAQRDYESIALTAPLDRSLSRKQKAMEKARTRFGQVDQIGDATQKSESLFRQGELYRELASAIMASERPRDLNELELMQYDILIEEQAFPFEEEAIKLHDRNHRRLLEAGYDQWIGNSISTLATMFPGRYQRQLRWQSWPAEAESDS